MSLPIADRPVEKKVNEILRLRPQQWLSMTNIPADAQLSRRELQVFFCTVMGYTAAAMAQMLNISTKTAESYLADVKMKLNCSSRMELFAKAIECGIVALGI